MAAGRYIDWSAIADRYPTVGDLSESDVTTPYIVPSEFEIDAMLATHFTVPFSSNNYTVHDLAIDWTYARLIKRAHPDLSKMVMDEVKGKIMDLKTGKAVMLTNSFDSVGAVGDLIFSTTQDYPPTFGVGHDADMLISSEQLYDEQQDRE